MNLNDFLPAYPSIVEQKEENPLFEESFNQALFKKKEFYDYKLEKTIPTEREGLFLNHQVIVQRFLSPYTMYDELFLYHEPGSGKTLSAIGVCENMFNSGVGSIKKATIIVNNEELIKTFVQELYNNIQTYMPNTEGIELLNPNLRADMLYRRAIKLVNERYTFRTYRTMSSSIQQLIKDGNENTLKREYNNQIIIFDEVHSILSQQSTDYSAFHTLFHLLDNRKLLLMSGTPMRNSVGEYARLLNLMLPLDEQLPMTDDSFSRFIQDNGNLLEVEQAVKGRVSYIRTRPDVEIRYMGMIIPGLLPIEIAPAYMSDYQYNLYQETIEEDVGDALYVNSRKISQFAFKNEMKKRTFFNLFKETKTNKERLKVLRDYSAKYANAVESILKSPNENCFVFTEFIKGVGAETFGWCLQLFGFKQTKSANNISTKEKRYTILSGGNPESSGKLINRFNQPNNKNGQYLQVLIGGKAVSEGYTFKNIQQIHILTPLWNFSGIDQAIARGVRYKSHNDLPQPVVVKIYLHVSIKKSRPMKEFIDMKIYETAYEKDKDIKALEYLTKITAFDCALAYERNVVENGTDNSRQCDYKECLYRCKGVDFPYTLSSDELDTTSYNKYYSNLSMSEFHNKIGILFSSVYSIPLPEIIKKMKNTYTLYEVMILIQRFIKYAIPIRNPLGIMSYLKIENDIIYTVNSVLDKEYTSNFYNRHPPAQLNTSFKRVIRQVVKNKLETFNDLPVEQQRNLLSQMSLENQEKFVEMSITEYGVDSWIVEYFGDQIIIEDDYITSTLVEPPRFFSRETGLWMDNKVIIGEVVGDITGSYNKKGKFIIIVKPNRGKACTSFKKEELLTIVETFNIPEIRKKDSVRIICGKIEQFFIENNLIR